MPRKYLNADYLRDVGTLVTGNVAAQALTLATAPLLTRLYGPESFGVLGLFVAMVAAISPGVGGRYEIAAIVASHQQREALFWVAMWFTFAVSIITLAAVVVVDRLIIDSSSLVTLGVWVWAIPISLFLTGSISNMRAWANATNDYSRLSQSVLIQSGVTAVAGVLFGAYGLGYSGLLLATNAGLLAAAAALAMHYRDLFRENRWRLDSEKTGVGRDFKDYPLFNAPTSVLNGLMSGMPVFFIAKHFPAEIVGYYALLIRVGAAPLTLVADAVSRVNLKKISDILNNKKNPMGYLTQVTGALCLLAAVPTIGILTLAPSIFAVAFGDAWREAGVLLAILMPALAVQFVVSTLSLSLVAAGHLRLLAVWQVLSLVVTILVFWWVGGGLTARDFFKVYMIKDVTLYLIYFFMLVYALRNPVNVASK